LSEKTRWEANFPRSIPAATINDWLSLSGAPAEFCNSSRCCVLELLSNLCIGLGWLVLAQSSMPAGQFDPRATAAAARDGSGSIISDGTSAKAAAETLPRAIDGRSPWFIILNSPQDLDELWRKIERPDLVLLRGDRVGGPARGAVGGANVGESARWLVQSVQIAGRVAGESADLSALFVITVKHADLVWVPIRLDNQRVIAAREGARDLSLRSQDRGEWQVSLTGEGEHRIKVALKSAVSSELARKRLSLAIPEAASTQVELNFARRESDVLIGADEDYGLTDLGQGKGTLVTAHLSPRSKLEVSWSENADSGGQPSPLVTAHGEIAIAIDGQQMRTRSSWLIRCVRGVAKSLVLEIDEHDEITELELDDQSLEDDIEEARGQGKLTIPLDDPIRAGASKRLVLRTRRSLAKSGARRFNFTGFPLSGAREQSGYIGITRSPNLYVGTFRAQGVYRIDPSKLPADLRARPSTSLAYEFRDQPFSLDFMVEPSPPQVRGETRTFFRIESELARSETAVDVSWVRGDLFELELGVAPGLQLISVGPPDSVETTNLTEAPAVVNEREAGQRRRVLSVRLTPLARDRGKVTLKLTAIEPISTPGSLKLGAFSLDRAASASALFAVAVGRGLSLELEDETGKWRRAPEVRSRFQNPDADLLEGALARAATSGPLFLVDDGNSGLLPIRITRQDRRLRHETSLAAKVSARSVDVVERVALSVRHGTVSSLEIRVPALVGDPWELVERQEVEREELNREPDGSRRYRLSFSRPVVDQATLRFRYRLPLVPVLESATAREVTIPAITIKDGEAEAAKALLELSPEIVASDFAPGWVRSSDDIRIEPAAEGPYIQFIEGDVRERRRPFSLKARALDQVSLPALVVPRLLIRTIRGSDGRARTTVRYWVESHGGDFPFTLPTGLEWIEARIDGRIVDRVDFDKTKTQYRIRFPGDTISKAALVELDLQEAAASSTENWRLPQLLGGGVVLQALWEVRLPWSLALVGVPRGWCDENRWGWTGLSWKRGPGKQAPGQNEWLLGATASASAIDDFTGSSDDEHDRYLFSRRGQPTDLHAWIVPGSWLVGICSGFTLVVGFLAIFMRVRFRTIWLVVAVVAVLAAILVEPTVSLLLLQAAALGALLSLVGLLIERSIERLSLRSERAERRGAAAIRPATDSSLNRSAGVGSDDSTAIRVRVPSTLDHVPVAVVAPETIPEARSSTVQRA
jgi:hypothetical protein